MDLICPKCGNADQSKMLGYEVRGVYDGVLFWGCMECGNKWPRFTPSDGRYYDLAVEAMNNWEDSPVKESNRVKETED